MSASFVGVRGGEQDLDWIVIRAQKSGTTTLFEHLVKHPELCLPASKEAPFFNSQTKYGGDWGTYLQTEFRAADPGCKRGTVTPQYMFGSSGPGVVVLFHQGPQL